MAYFVKTEDVLEELKSNHVNGLSEIEADNRLKRDGQNIVEKEIKTTAIARFASQFNSPLIYILLIAAITATLLGHTIDAFVIFGVVLANSIIGFIQEGKAQDAISALEHMIVTKTYVIRNGQKRRIDARLVTVGDIVLLSSGDKAPADIRIIGANNLQIDESALTGESVPVSKQDAILHPSTPLPNRVNMAYAGSLVTYGQGYGVVIAVGNSTEIGKVAKLIRSTKKLETPLLKKIDKLGNFILIFIAALSLLTFTIGMLRGESLGDMLIASVALAVGAIPEGLPAAITIMLAIGVSAMAAKNAVIRALPSVETLGCATVICSDKTGTLTKNEMSVQKIFAGGVFYSANKLDNIAKEIESDTDIIHLLRIGVLCNDSKLKDDNGEYVHIGDPTEIALILLAKKAGIDEAKMEATYPRIDSMPFESDKQFMATLHRADGKNLLLVKGSFEKISQFCNESPAINTLEEMAKGGLRVLAFAAKDVDETSEIITEDMLYGLNFVGFQAMMDSPREEAKSAIEACKKAKIVVKMITGDHAITAKNIAVSLGICEEGDKVLSGVEIAALDDESLKEAVKSVNVYARVSPEQKLRLVEAMQANGEVVAMTGDGVNDAPALKRSNIGIAMGKGGSDVSREAADIALTDDNFASIVAAVEEGRNIYEKFIKFIIWTLPTNIGEGMVIFFAVLTATALPMLPTQILWINMTTAVLLGLMLVFEPNEQRIMQRPPRLQSAPILSAQALFRMSLVGALMVAGAFLAFRYELDRGNGVEYAQTVAVTVFVAIEGFYLFNCRSIDGSIFKINFFTNKPLLVGVGTMVFLQALFIYAPFMNALFKSTPINADSLAYAIASGVVVMLAVEVEKKLFTKL